MRFTKYNLAIDALRHRMPSLFVRNLVAAVAGSALAQIVVFAFSPIVTRVYNPDAFGIQGVFLSLISIFSPLVALRYPMAIVVAKSNAQARNISYLSLWISVFISCVIGLILLGFRDRISSLLGADLLGSLIYFLPIALLCVALQDIAVYRAARVGAFRKTATTTVVQALAANSARVIGGLWAPTAGTLVVVTSFAPMVQTWLLEYRRRHSRVNLLAIHKKEAWVILKAYRSFPIYRVPNDMLNAGSQAIPVILLAALFSPAVAGLYTLTRSVINLPVNIIGSSIGNVLYARFADVARARGPIAPLMIRLTLALSLLAPLIIGSAYFAPEVFSFVFGAEWREAGQYAQWMSLWIAFGVANIPAIRIVPVIDEQNLLLIFNIFLLVVRTLSIYIGYIIYNNALSSVALFSIVSAILNIVIIVLILRSVLRYDRSASSREDSGGLAA